MKRIICSNDSYKRGLRSHTNRWGDQFKALLDTVILSMKSYGVYSHGKVRWLATDRTIP